MSDQNVTVRIDAKPTGNLAAPFNDLAKAAGSADKALKPGANSLKEWANEAKGLNKSLMSLQGGLNSLAMSSSALPEGFGKVIDKINVLSGVDRKSVV